MGCFNMSCAVTGTPIMCFDDMVVALASESDQMSSVVHPVYFFGKYNDYGTVEEYNEESFEVAWFKSFIDKEKLSGGLDEVVRDLVEGESTEAEHKKLSLLPGRFVHNMRVVFIHRMVWDRIIDYRTKRCSSWDYFNESSWRLDPEKEVTEKIENLAELYEIERKLDSGEFADDDDGKWHMKLLRLSGSATNHVIQHEEAEHYFEFCKENNLDPMETLPKLIEIYKTAFTVSGFAMEINSHLKTRYAGQEGCEEEYGVLISMMQQRMQDVKDRYEE